MGRMRYSHEDKVFKLKKHMVQSIPVSNSVININCIIDMSGKKRRRCCHLFSYLLLWWSLSKGLICPPIRKIRIFPLAT